MQPQCLENVNKSRHADIFFRTVAAINVLQKTGEKVSFYAVADRAQVSRSTLYRCPDLRELVEAARANTAPSARVSPSDLDARIADLEGMLTQVLRERDAYKQAIDAIALVRYAFVRVGAAA